TVGFRPRRVRLSSAEPHGCGPYPAVVDTDALIAVHRQQLARLRELTRSRTLDADGIDALLTLYHETSTQVSTIRSNNPDPTLVSRLSLLVHQARLRITGARTPLWKHARTFFWEDLPAALYESRWTVALATGIFLLAAVTSGVYFGLD